jgi:hypothetical protein
LAYWSQRIIAIGAGLVAGSVLYCTRMPSILGLLA